MAQIVPVAKFGDCSRCSIDIPGCVMERYTNREHPLDRITRVYWITSVWLYRNLKIIYQLKMGKIWLKRGFLVI